MARVAATGASANHSRVSLITGVKFDSAFSGNNGMAAAVLSPGGVFVTTYTSRY